MITGVKARRARMLAEDKVMAAALVRMRIEKQQARERMQAEALEKWHASLAVKVYDHETKGM